MIAWFKCFVILYFESQESRFTVKCLDLFFKAVKLFSIFVIYFLTKSFLREIERRRELPATMILYYKVANLSLLDCRDFFL